MKIKSSEPREIWIGGWVFNHFSGDVSGKYGIVPKRLQPAKVIKEKNQNQ